jgi:hypothetical protein
MNASTFKIRKRVVFPDKESYQDKDSPRALATPFRQKVLKSVWFFGKEPQSIGVS